MTPHSRPDKMVSTQCELPTLQEFDCRSRYRESRYYQCLVFTVVSGVGWKVGYRVFTPLNKTMDTGSPVNGWFGKGDSVLKYGHLKFLGCISLQVFFLATLILLQSFWEVPRAKKHPTYQKRSHWHDATMYRVGLLYRSHTSCHHLVNLSCLKCWLINQFEKIWSLKRNNCSLRLVNCTTSKGSTWSSTSPKHTATLQHPHTKFKVVQLQMHVLDPKTEGHSNICAGAHVPENIADPGDPGDAEGRVYIPVSWSCDESRRLDPLEILGAPSVWFLP